MQTKHVAPYTKQNICNARQIAEIAVYFTPEDIRTTIANINAGLFTVRSCHCFKLQNTPAVTGINQLG